MLEEEEGEEEEEGGEEEEDEEEIELVSLEMTRTLPSIWYSMTSKVL